MSENVRFVGISEKQHFLLEDIGIDMLRRADPRAPQILSLVLLWRRAAPAREVPIVDADAQPRDIPARMLHVLEGGR